MQPQVISSVNILSRIVFRCREKGYSAIVEELVQNKPKRVNVYRIIAGKAPEELGCHIGNRADSAQSLCGTF